MNNKTKKILIFAGIGLDVAITVFLFIVSIIMLVKIGMYGDAEEAAKHSSEFVVMLLKNTTLYFWAFVFPLFILLAGNIVGLVIYVKKSSAKDNAPTKLDDLSEEQKEALRQELLKDLMKNSAPEEAKDNKEE